ncbi:MAG: HAMP domain-containing sensor histidine kinase, partial [Spirochaetales bacterium]|nr:HAMP domain-containing sensor histidine kinase [Spirochaetales bacterium]
QYDGKCLRIAELRDISDIKRTQEELKLTKELAEEGERLKTAFLANVSHEIRTPMNGILGFSELLKDPSLTTDVRNKYIDIIEESGRRMLATITNLIDISKIESAEPELIIESCDLNTLVLNLFALFKPDADKKNIDFNFSCGLKDNYSRIEIDVDKLTKVLQHFLQNAIKFTDSGIIDFGYYKLGEEIVFYVRDTGCGIAEDKHEKIFERFVQEDNSYASSYEGSGLGLSISKAFAKTLKGRIRLESKKGEGSTFSLVIPYAPVV